MKQARPSVLRETRVTALLVNGALLVVAAVALAPIVWMVSVSFMPTGGIGPSNLASYLAWPRIVACGGSWMAPNEWIAGRQFDRIRETTSAAVSIVTARPDGGKQ